MPVNQTLTWEDFIQRIDLFAEEVEDLDMREPLTKCKVLIVADTKERFSRAVDPDGNPWPVITPRPDGTSHPLWHQGLLVRSIGGGVGYVEEMTATTLTVGTQHHSAWIHQHGGVIGAKSGRKLAIPLSREAMGKSPRQQPAFPRPLFQPRGKNVLAEVRKKGRGKKAKEVLVVHYALVTQVTIKARPFIGFGEDLLAKLDKVWYDWTEKELEG
jgi:phage gpG-like protein